MIAPKDIVKRYPVLIFSIHGTVLAVQTDYVHAVMEERYTVSLPGEHQGVTGLLYANGEIIPVMDVEKNGGMPRMILLTEYKKVRCGIVIDKTLGLREVAFLKKRGRTKIGDYTIEYTYESVERGEKVYLLQMRKFIETLLSTERTPDENEHHTQ